MFLYYFSRHSTADGFPALIFLYVFLLVIRTKHIFWTMTYTRNLDRNPFAVGSFCFKPIGSRCCRIFCYHMTTPRWVLSDSRRSNLLSIMYNFFFSFRAVCLRSTAIRLFSGGVCSFFRLENSRSIVGPRLVGQWRTNAGPCLPPPVPSSSRKWIKNE